MEGSFVFYVFVGLGPRLESRHSLSSNGRGEGEGSSGG